MLRRKRRTRSHLSSPIANRRSNLVFKVFLPSYSLPSPSAMEPWGSTLLEGLSRLHKNAAEDGGGSQEELLELLRASRKQSGLTRIGFDNRVRSLGINVVSFRVHGSEEGLRAAIVAGKDLAAKNRFAIPWEVKTACLIHL